MKTNLISSPCGNSKESCLKEETNTKRLQSGLTKLWYACVNIQRDPKNGVDLSLRVPSIKEFLQHKLTQSVPKTLFSCKCNTSMLNLAQSLFKKGQIVIP